MTAKELFQAGRLTEAVQALSAELRDNPTDARRRTFLFELLCFAGEYDRAERQLDVLAQSGPPSELGAVLYRSALAAERIRHEMFSKREFPAAPGAAEPPLSGTLNGTPFESLEDADPRVGVKLEVFAAGNYLWLPLAHLASIQIAAPRRLRDLLWTPAGIRTGPGFKGVELGEVFLPVLYAGTWRHSDDAVRLGRTTVWEEEADGQAVPFGQKMLLVDGEEIPLLEVRTLEINAAAEAAG
jgi:type VI secretion system protein ImpE